MDAQQQLTQIFTFTEDDLAANRQHEFSAAQQDNLNQQASLGWQAFGLAGGVVLVALVIGLAQEFVNPTVPAFAENINYGVVVIIVLLFIPAIWGGMLYFRQGARKDLKRGVAHVSGPLTIIELESGDMGFLQVANESFLITEPQYHALKDLPTNLLVSVYYKPRSRQILSVGVDKGNA